MTPSEANEQMPINVYYHPETDEIYVCEPFNNYYVMTTWNDMFWMNETWLSSFEYLGEL